MAIKINDTLSRVEAMSGSAEEVLAEDMTRIKLSLFNLDTTNTIYLLFAPSGDASASDCTIPLGPGKGFVWDGAECPGDRISGIASAGTPNLAIGVWQV